jgi:hypothetical protein
VDDPGAEPDPSLITKEVVKSHTRFHWVIVLIAGRWSAAPTAAHVSPTGGIGSLFGAGFHEKLDLIESWTYSSSQTRTAALLPSLMTI